MTENHRQSRLNKFNFSRHQKNCNKKGYDLKNNFIENNCHLNMSQVFLKNWVWFWVKTDMSGFFKLPERF